MMEALTDGHMGPQNFGCYNIIPSPPFVAGNKNNIICFPCLSTLYVKYGMPFAKVDERQMPAYTISSPMSLWLSYAKNDHKWSFFHVIYTVLFGYNTSV